MRYSLRNKQKIAAAYSEDYLNKHIIASLDKYFTQSDEQITDDAMQEFLKTSNGAEYPLLRVNDVADEEAMIEVAVVGQQYDVLKLSFWDYDGELPQPKQEQPQQPVKMPNMKELQEKAFRDNVSESTKKMIERLTLDEQMRVSFVPLIITHLAWVYADKAMACAARDKVSLLKKLSRTLKMVHQKYNEELRRELDYNHLQNVIRQTEMCISEINRDLTILYFSVNQELKRKVPQYGFDEQRTYAVISTLFIDLLKQHNREMDKLLAEKLNDRNLAPSIVPPLIQHLHTGMVAFAGVEGKFDYREQNVVTAMKVIKNRIDSIEFSVF